MKRPNLVEKTYYALLKPSALIIFVLSFLLTTPKAHARIWYVMYDGGPGWSTPTAAPFVQGPNDTNWNKAGRGIRQTMDATINTNLKDGDEIWVAGGDVNGGGITKAGDHYRMDYTMQLTKNIKIIGGFPRPNAKPGVLEPTMADRDMVKYATIFDGSDMTGDKKLFNMKDPLSNASFDGFYVINGASGWGAGIYMQGGLTISNCVFANNNSTDIAPTDRAGGGAVHATGGVLVNCIFTNNQAGNKGGALFLEGAAKMINCTVVNNKAKAGDNGSAVYLYGTGCTAYNTVFWNNGGSTNDVGLGNGATIEQVKNCAYNTMSTSHSSNIQISTNNASGLNPPFFVTPSNTATLGIVAGWSFASLGNWYLQNALSSLWDKGDNQHITPYSTVDIVNRPRIRNGIVDIGSYEVQPLYITGAVIAPKTYDGSPLGALSNNGTLVGIIGTDAVTINSVTAVYSDKNAANPKNIKISYTLAGADGLKYFVEPIDTIDAIGKRAITVTANAQSKIYSNSALTTPSLTYQITSGSMVAGETLTGSLSCVAGETVTTPGPNYKIEQNNLDAGSNYTLTYQPANLTILKKELTITGLTIADRGFAAGNFTAPIASWGTLSGIVAPDAVTLVTTGITANYTSDAAGGNKPVSFSANPTIAGAQSNNYFVTMPAVTGNIGVSSTVISLTYPNLVYDGNPKTITSTHLPNDIANDIVTTAYYKGGVLQASTPTDAGTYDVKIIVSGVSFSATKTETYTISPKPISVIVGDAIKTYNNNTASLMPSLTFKAGDVVASDAANLSILTNTTQPSASYTSQTAGIGNRVVNITGIQLTGNRAFNYTISPSAQNTTSTINKKTVIIVADSTSKIYDGLTTVTKIPALTFAPEIMSGDVVTMTPTFANTKFDTKDAGVNKTVTISNITLTGDSLLNYAIDNNATNSNCVISRRTFPFIYIKADSVVKIYDGNRNTPIPFVSVMGILAGDDVVASTNSNTYGLYNNKDVGTNKEAGFVGIVLSGLQLNNYLISPNVTTYKNAIIPRPLNDSTYIEVADTTKAYDGNTSIATPMLTVKGLAEGDTIIPIRNASTATFDTKNAGTKKTVTVTGWTFSATDSIAAKNYTWQPSYANKNSSITQYRDTINTYIALSDTFKTYDGTTNSAVPSLKIIGLLPGDNINPIRTTASATFNSPSAGKNKTVTATGWTFSPNDSIVARNYLWRTSYSNNSSTILPFNVKVLPSANQRQKYNELPKAITYTTNSILPNNEALAGLLEREPGTTVGQYKILQGTVTNSNNGNYSISFISDVMLEIYSDIIIDKKWGYTLVVNNAAKGYKAYQWYKNDELIPGQTLQWYSIEKPLCGVYKVLITLNDGTQVFAQETDETASCTKSARAISISPTATRGGATLLITDEEGVSYNIETIYNISIYAISGAKVASHATSNLNSFTFAAPMASGTYIVRIENSTGPLTTQKVVIY